MFPERTVRDFAFDVRAIAEFAYPRRDACPRRECHQVEQPHVKVADGADRPSEVTQSAPRPLDLVISEHLPERS